MWNMTIKYVDLDEGDQEESVPISYDYVGSHVPSVTMEQMLDEIRALIISVQNKQLEAEDESDSDDEDYETEEGCSGKTNILSKHERNHRSKTVSNNYLEDSSVVIKSSQHFGLLYVERDISQV